MRGLGGRLGRASVTLVLAAAGLAMVFLGTGSDPRLPSEAAASPMVSWPTITLTHYISGLTEPVQVTHAGDGSGRLFVVERAGHIHVFSDDLDMRTTFLSIADRVNSKRLEQGLLSMAFPPAYEETRVFYVNYTDLDGNTVVARYRVSEDPNRANRDSETVVLSQTQPYANHNGGQLAFGPDGYLYIGLGDGGSAGDPHDYAQDPTSWLGKLLRIDVSPPGLPRSTFTGTHRVFMPWLTGGRRPPYTIPASNPYTGTAGYRDEIWALGLRNPWRFSFDGATGDLHIGDVGQASYEEVDFQPVSSDGGRNYGWSIMEGAHCYPSPPCDRTGLVLPVAQYDHTVGRSVTGGMVYRGEAYPGMAGIYFYGDFGSGRIWGLVRDEGVWRTTELADTDLAIASFGEDEAGNLYLVDFQVGVVYRIVAIP